MKVRRRATVAGFLVVLGGAGCAPSGPTSSMSASAAPAGSEEQGARIWRATCDRCHNARSALEFDAEQWPVIVAHMRTRAGLTRTEARAVSEYLRGMSERMTHSP